MEHDVVDAAAGSFTAKLPFDISCLPSISTAAVRKRGDHKQATTWWLTAPAVGVRASASI